MYLVSTFPINAVTTVCIFVEEVVVVDEVVVVFVLLEEEEEVGVLGFAPTVIISRICSTRFHLPSSITRYALYESDTLSTSIGTEKV